MAAQEVARTLLALSLVLSPLPAFAQQPLDPQALDEQKREELGQLFTRAQAAYEAGNYLEAIEALRAAHGIFPEPNILYRIGDAYESLGDLEHAAEFYTRYVKAAPQASDAGLVRRRVADLERRAAELADKLKPTEPERAALLLDSNPAGASVRLDDRSVEDTTPVRVELAPGNHRVELLHDGYLPVVREIRIDAGETISLVYQLEKEAVAPTPEPRGPGAWPWIVGGTGLLSLGTGVGFFLGANAAKDKVETWDAERATAYANQGVVPDRPDGYDAATKNRVTYRNTAYIAGGVGAAALIGGITWLVLSGGEEEPVSLLLGPTSASMRVRF